LLGDFTFELNSSAAFDQADQRAGMILLGSMLLSFGFIRFSTRMIRAEVSWWPGNVTPGGLHIHHLVFGIVFMMTAGFLAFVIQPYSPWFEILAGLFGVGMGLTLDEFALWLHLEDVYWSEEGRSSVDAVVFAAIRLAWPGSWWARRRYAPVSGKLVRAEARKARHDRRVRRFQDLIGGAPSLPSPGAERSGRK